jgi:hypothetical protein
VPFAAFLYPQCEIIIEFQSLTMFEVNLHNLCKDFLLNAAIDIQFDFYTLQLPDKYMQFDTLINLT